MVQSGLYGSVGADGVAVTYGDGKPVRDPVIVLVYRGGRKLAAYRYSQIVFRGRLISQSVSHVNWLVRSTPHHEQPPLLDKTLTLNTTSFRTVTIDLETGKLAAEDSPLWKRCSVIAYGEVKKRGAGYRMDPAYLAKGEARPHVDFTAPASVSLGSPGSYVTLCLEKRKGKLVATEVIDILLNALTAP